MSFFFLSTDTCNNKIEVLCPSGIKTLRETNHGFLQKGISQRLPFSNTLFFITQHEAMTSAAVDVIGAVCKRLTWSKYLYYLKHFIHVLQTGIVEQKLAVR